MGKKSNKRSAGNRIPVIVSRWEAYFGDGSLDDWQRLCDDLGLQGGDYTSINQCRKAVGRVHVNIYDFLNDVEIKEPVRRFGSVRQLAVYTRATGKFFPRKYATQLGPVSALSRQITNA